MDSIISNERECYVCKTTQGLHKHHILYGSANRKKSEEYGCWVYLCARHHNMSDDGVHFNKQLDLTLKQLCQLKWQQLHGDKVDFIRVFGKSFI